LIVLVTRQCLEKQSRTFLGKSVIVSGCTCSLFCMCRAKLRMEGVKYTLTLSQTSQEMFCFVSPDIVSSQAQSKIFWKFKIWLYNPEVLLYSLRARILRRTCLGKSVIVSGCTWLLPFSILLYTYKKGKDLYLFFSL
jgi:hypothetical protein